MTLITAMEDELKRRLQASIISIQSVSGGSINQAFKITINTQNYFCKINSAYAFPDLFKKEAAGLSLIRNQDVIITPEVIEVFQFENTQVLLLEWIVRGTETETFWEAFGKQLAALHHCHHASFGLDDSNYMGSVRQSNEERADWDAFFQEQRLEPLVRQCMDKNLLSPCHQKKFERLYKNLPVIFDQQAHSLLHGDLWSGNYLCNISSKPVLIDPATYYGHPSIDLAMTTLFGGFPSSFYQSYNYHFPFPKNYSEQWSVCNLYPLLIHLLLFGRAYLHQIENTLTQFD